MVRGTIIQRYHLICAYSRMLCIAGALRRGGNSLNRGLEVRRSSAPRLGAHRPKTALTAGSQRISPKRLCRELTDERLFVEVSKRISAHDLGAFAHSNIVSSVVSDHEFLHLIHEHQQPRR